MTTRIFIVRHGQTEWAITNRFAGRTNIPLTEIGIQQAEKLSQSLAAEHIDVCYTSPLLRCMQTAGILVHPHGLELNQKPEFMELDFGVWDGLLGTEILEKYAEEWQRWTEDPAARAPQQGENGYQLAARAVPALYEIIEKWLGKTMLVVTHKVVIRVLLSHLMNIPLKEYRQSIPQETCALNEVFLEDNGRFRVERINDITHLVR